MTLDQAFKCGFGCSSILLRFFMFSVGKCEEETGRIGFQTVLEVVGSLFWFRLSLHVGRRLIPGC